MSEERDNVIHVAFGRDGVGTRIAAPAPLAPSPSEAPKSQKPSDDPLADLYSTADVAKLFDLRESRLRSWAKSGFITPSATVGKKQLYTFQDLVSVPPRPCWARAVPQKRVKDSVDAIRRTLPKVTRPLAELRVTEEGGSVVCATASVRSWPTTGQQVSTLDVSRSCATTWCACCTRPTAEARRSAYEHYLEGCRLDEDEATFERAEAAYLAALRLDASLGNAHTNLGNLCYRRGRVEDARRTTRTRCASMASSPRRTTTWGSWRWTRGTRTNAVLSFERAGSGPVAFADAHFNLPLAYEELGRARDAKPALGDV
ncbi:MAG: hypothetical protein IPG81_27615, partial [Sandaracinaceae bacterium]|nr:hypothetical protein [Sandaracinaceae bacterium]